MNGIDVYCATCGQSLRYTTERYQYPHHDKEFLNVDPCSPCTAKLSGKIDDLEGKVDELEATISQCPDE